MMEQEQPEEWKLDSSPPKTHTRWTYIPGENKRKDRKKGKRDDQDHKGMTQECVHDVKRRTKREKRIMADGHDSEGEDETLTLR